MEQYLRWNSILDITRIPIIWHVHLHKLTYFIISHFFVRECCSSNSPLMNWQLNLLVEVAIFWLHHCFDSFYQVNVQQVFAEYNNNNDKFITIVVDKVFYIHSFVINIRKNEQITILMNVFQPWINAKKLGFGKLKARIKR